MKPAWQQELIKQRQAQAQVRMCDHCHTGKSHGTRLHDGKSLWLCVKCASAVARTGALP